jgi:hypothetical protein
MLLSERSTGILLLWLKLLVVSLELRRSARQFHWWRVNHTILWWHIAGTTSGGSWCDPLPLLFLNHLTSPHGALLIYGSAGKIIVGQVQILY